MSWIEAVASRLDAFQQRTRPLAFACGVIKKFGDDHAGNLAALVAYYAFFSIFPLLLVLVTSLAFVFGPDNPVSPGVLQTFPVIGQEIQTGAIRGSGVAIAIGLAAALWAGLGVMNAMQDAMNAVWHVPIKRRPNLFDRVGRSGIMLAAFGVGTIASSALAGWGIGLPAPAAMAISATINLGIFLVAFRVLPDEDLSWGDVFPGALVGAILWTGLQLLAGWFIDRQVRGATGTYGTFAVVIGLLSWLYLGAQGSLVAAEINVVRRRRLWPRSLVHSSLTEADRRALISSAGQEERRHDEQVVARFTPVDRRRSGSPP